MELIDQNTKKIMEECKVRARAAGLRFCDETLEYIVTNRDLLELGPKGMIPTLYDYWVHEVRVIGEKGKYELFPRNPYETVINTRPAISFYNDNNPDWLNVMIFYHVLAHIDFFQNNRMYQKTWGEDFTGLALSDKRAIALLRSEKGHWVDYVIEFTRGIDNLVSYYYELGESDLPKKTSEKVNFYFDIFLQEKIVAPDSESAAKPRATQSEYLKEIERFNIAAKQHGETLGESFFFAEVVKKWPEFQALFEKAQKEKKENDERERDLIGFVQENSPFLRRQENKWMKTVMEIVRRTSLHFQPQIRTKIANEGWASYWHEKLFLADERIRGHEVDYARVNADVTAVSRLGLNPYAIGMRLFAHIEEAAQKGKLSYEFEKVRDVEGRRRFDKTTGRGIETIFRVRENCDDFSLINSFVDQDFVDRYKLFVAGKRLNKEKAVWEYFIQSRKAEDYRQMLVDELYHPPFIEVVCRKTEDGQLYLEHHFEGKPLVREYIEPVMRGLVFLWGGDVALETSEARVDGSFSTDGEPAELLWQRMLYVFDHKHKQLSHLIL